MGTGQAAGEGRALAAAEAAIANPLFDDTALGGANGLLVAISGGPDMTLFEVAKAAARVREEVDVNANVVVGARFDDALEGSFKVSIVATGLRQPAEVIFLAERLA